MRSTVIGGSSGGGGKGGGIGGPGGGSKHIGGYGGADVGVGGRGVRGGRKKPMSRSFKVGLLFPVGRIRTNLKKGRYSARVSGLAVVYMASVLEYIAAEVANIAGIQAKASKKKMINPRHIVLGLANVNDFVELLKNVHISGGCVIPNINPFLLALEGEGKKWETVKRTGKEAEGTMDKEGTLNKKAEGIMYKGAKGTMNSKVTVMMNMKATVEMDRESTGTMNREATMVMVAMDREVEGKLEAVEDKHIAICGGADVRVGGSGVRGGRKKPVSRSIKVGLLFPAGRIRTNLKKGRYNARVSGPTAVYMASVLEYMAAEV